MPSQAVAQVLTCLVEAPVVMIILRKHWRAHSVDQLRCVLSGIVPSLLTHPLAWAMMGRFGAHDYAQGLAWVEAAVVLAEALQIAVLARCTWRSALCVSLVANATSTLAGWLLWPLL